MRLSSDRSAKVGKDVSNKESHCVVGVCGILVQEGYDIRDSPLAHLCVFDATADVNIKLGLFNTFYRCWCFAAFYLCREIFVSLFLDICCLANRMSS